MILLSVLYNPKFIALNNYLYCTFNRNLRVHNCTMIQSGRFSIEYLKFWNSAFRSTGFNHPFQSHFQFRIAWEFSKPMGTSRLLSKSDRCNYTHCIALTRTQSCIIPLNLTLLKNILTMYLLIRIHLDQQDMEQRHM